MAVRGLQPGQTTARPAEQSERDRASQREEDQELSGELPSRGSARPSLRRWSARNDRPVHLSLPAGFHRRRHADCPYPITISEPECP